jgi:hypothetical protein
MLMRWTLICGLCAAVAPRASRASRGGASGVTRTVLSAETDDCPMRAQWGDYVEISHRGYYGDALIDSNGDGPGALPLVVQRLGQGLIIDGMELGIAGMCVGATHSIGIPPHLAYDNPKKNFHSKPVPVGASVRYEITLLKIGPRPSIFKALSHPGLWCITAAFALVGYAAYTFAARSAEPKAKYRRPGKLRGGTGKGLRQRTKKGKRGAGGR